MSSQLQDYFEEAVARIGAWIGNWNDRRFGTDVGGDAPRIYRLLDRLAGWLYTRGEDR